MLGINPDEQVWNHAKERLVKLFIDSKATLKSSVLAIFTLDPKAE